MQRPEVLQERSVALATAVASFVGVAGRSMVLKVAVAMIVDGEQIRFAARTAQDLGTETLICKHI